MSFLPENYTAPKSNSGYLKIQEGETRIRILSRPIIGWEDWDNKKPIRFRFEAKPDSPVDPKKPVRHFWSMLVWSYNEEQIQILHLTQRSIQNKIQSLSNDKDWGEPYFYDIKIIKEGQGIDTEYDVNPLPHKELSPEIEQAFHEKPCYLEALYDNADPFDKKWNRPTPGVFKKTATASDKPSMREIDELCEMLASCPEDFQKEMNDKLAKAGKKISELNMQSFQTLFKKTKDARDDFMLKNSEVPF